LPIDSRKPASVSSDSLSWVSDFCHCKEQIGEGFHAAERSTFSSLTRAETYLRIAESSVSAKNVADAATVFAECLATLPPILPSCSPPRVMEQEVKRVVDKEEEDAVKNQHHHQCNNNVLIISTVEQGLEMLELSPLNYVS
jgi:hypothetical protein